VPARTPSTCTTVLRGVGRGVGAEANTRASLERRVAPLRRHAARDRSLRPSRGADEAHRTRSEHRKSDREIGASLILYSSLCECVSAKCCVGIEVGAEGVAFGEWRCWPLAGQVVRVVKLVTS
jgi:hypothetical protein